MKCPKCKAELVRVLVDKIEGENGTLYKYEYRCPECDRKEMLGSST